MIVSDYANLATILREILLKSHPANLPSDYTSGVVLNILATAKDIYEVNLDYLNRQVTTTSTAFNLYFYLADVVLGRDPVIPITAIVPGAGEIVENDIRVLAHLVLSMPRTSVESMHRRRVDTLPMVLRWRELRAHLGEYAGRLDVVGLDDEDDPENLPVEQAEAIATYYAITKPIWKAFFASKREIETRMGYGAQLQTHSLGDESGYSFD